MKRLWDHPLSMYTKFSEKLTFLTSWYAHVCVRIGGLEILVFWKILRTYLMDYPFIIMAPLPFLWKILRKYTLLKSSRLLLKYAYNYFSKCFLTHFMSLVSFYGDSIPVRFNKVLELMLINFLKIFTFVGICLRIVFPKFSAQYLFRFPFLVRSRFLGLTGYFCFKGFLH